MKLKCSTHGRRVLSVGSRFAHRTGDMSACADRKAVLVDNTSHITRTFHILTDGTLQQSSCNKQQKPHAKRKKE